MTPVMALLSCTVGDIYMSSLGHGGERHVSTRDAQVIENFVRIEDLPYRGVYHCVSTMRGRRSKENARECAFLHADIDSSQPRPALPPTMEVNSGRGKHYYWLLQEPVPASDATDALLKRLAQAVGGDAAVTHRAALMRAVGSHNTKGGGWREVTCRAHPQRVYTLDQVSSWLGAPAVDHYAEYAAKFPRDPINVSDMLLGMQPGNIHTTQLACLASLAEGGDDEEEAVGIVMEATRIAAHGLVWDWGREEFKLRKMYSTWQVKRGRTV